MKRLCGTLFCLLSGILYAARVIAATIYAAGGWSFSTAWRGFTVPLLICSILSLVVGLYYIVTAEVKESKRRMEQSEDSGGVP